MPTAEAKSASHTPGPWVVQGARTSDMTWAVGRADCGAVAFVRGMENAALVRAAPDLLALAHKIVRLACTEELSTHVEVGFEPQDAAMLLAMAEAAIAAAQPT